MKLILKSKLSNSIRGIDIETEIEQFCSVILILKPRSWNANGGIDIVTATVEYDFHYRTSNGILKTSIAHACGIRAGQIKLIPLTSWEVIVLIFETI